MLKLNNWAFLIVVVFFFFDSIRSNLIGGNIISLFREFVVFYLILYTLKKYSKASQGVIRPSLRCFIAYHIIISLYSLIAEGPVQWSFVIKPLEFCGILYVFYYYEKLTGKNYSNLIRIIVNTSVIFSIVNVVLYFIPLPIWNRDEFWWGRISCGYPTLDVISQAYAIILLLYYPTLNYSTVKSVFYLMILSAGIMLNFSGTGTVILFLIMVVSIIPGVLYKRRLKFLSIYIIVVISSFSIIVTYISTNFPNEYQMGIVLLEEKYGNLTGQETGTGNTLETRKEQMEKVSSHNKNIISILFGQGLNYATNDDIVMQKYSKAYMIENQFSLIQVCYGYWGLLLFLYIIFDMSIYTFYKIGDKQYKIMILLAILVFIANSYVLLPFILFPNMIGLALFTSLQLLQSKKIKT